MSIKNLGELGSTLQNYETRGWASKVGNDLHDSFDIKESTGMEETQKGKTFGEFLQDSLVKVNDMQVQADQAMQKLASGESQNLHETLLNVEKAEISFKMMNQIRSKVIDAYKEMMRMQV
jgi:flagellar hook-basal body complex protein FliE